MATFEVGGAVFEVQQLRDGNNNMVQVELIEPGTGAAFPAWEITYGERSL